MKLFISEIIVDGRIRKNPTHIKELIDDIKENGQIQPITVRIGSVTKVSGISLQTLERQIKNADALAQQSANNQ